MTKYVDASPFELLEGRLLPNDWAILAVGGFVTSVAAAREGVFHVEHLSHHPHSPTAPLAPPSERGVLTAIFGRVFEGVGCKGNCWLTKGL